MWPTFRKLVRMGFEASVTTDHHVPFNSFTNTHVIYINTYIYIYICMKPTEFIYCCLYVYDFQADNSRICQ